jgi:hypothetical protein
MEYIGKMKNVLITGLAALILGSFGGCTEKENLPVGLRNQGGAVSFPARIAIDDYQKGIRSRIDEICNYQGEKYIFENGEWIDTEESCTKLGSATGPSDINRILENHSIKKGQLPKIKTYQRGKLVTQTKGNTMEEFEYNTKERTITRKVTDYDKDKVSKETCYFGKGFSVIKCGKETKGDDGQVVETYEDWESEPLVFGGWNSWLRELWNERKSGVHDLLQ